MRSLGMLARGMKYSTKLGLQQEWNFETETLGGLEEDGFHILWNWKSQHHLPSRLRGRWKTREEMKFQFHKTCRTPLNRPL